MGGIRAYKVSSDDGESSPIVTTVSFYSVSLVSSGVCSDTSLSTSVSIISCCSSCSAVLTSSINLPFYLLDI